MSSLRSRVDGSILRPMVTRAESKQYTREALILAAMELFREQGLDGPSLDAICERAGKTRGAFYVHFADRDALQVAVMEEILLAYVALIASSTDPAVDLLRSIDNFVDALSDLASGGSRSPIGVLGGDQLRLLLEGVHRSAAVRERFVTLVRAAEWQLTGVVAAAQAGGRVRRDVPAAGIAAVLIGLVFGLMALLETTRPTPELVEETRTTLTTLLAPGSPA